MIFVTVGTQFPFERLVNGVDAWASRHASRPAVFAQVGEHEGTLSAIEHESFVDAVRCNQLTDESDVVVAHAGVGTVLTALSMGTPVIVMPRRADLGEHRNNHQLDTVKWMRQLDGVTVVESVEELETALDAFAASGSTPVRLAASADPQLLRAISGFVAKASLRRRPVWVSLPRAAWRAAMSLVRRTGRQSSSNDVAVEHSTLLNTQSPTGAGLSSPEGAIDEATKQDEPAANQPKRRKARLASAAAL